MRAQDFVNEALHFVRPGELRGSYSDQQMLAMGFRRSQNGGWYIDQRRWDDLTRRGQLKEVNYPDELTVSDRIQDYFYKRGYSLAGEGRDQMAFESPRGTVLKIVGIGEDEREQIVKNYVKFFANNQDDPYIPRIYSVSDFTVDGETYFLYEMEYLNYVANEEQTLDYLEGLMDAVARGKDRAREFMDRNPRPQELNQDDIVGLVNATLKLEKALGGQAPLDLSQIENLRRRSDGHIVIMDPYSL